MGAAGHERNGGRLREVARWVWRGRTDRRARATWRLVVPVVVLVATAAIGTRLLGVVTLPDALVNAPELAVVLVGLVGSVATARRLGNRSADDVGIGIGAAWGRDLAVGIGIDLLFQAAVTVLWSATGDLTVTNTLASGGATGTTEVVVASVAAAFAFLIVGL